MPDWPAKPFIYEINTWVWLTSLSQRYNDTITLHNVPETVLDELGALKVDAIWLMGIWQRNPDGRNSALNYTHEYQPVLADLTDDDVIGSAYAIGDYRVDDRLGGRDGLAALRARLQARGLKLILDFVPNHVGTDHPWISHKPSYLVRAYKRETRKHPDMFFAAKDAWGRSVYVAHGRDPYFPPWIDTAQVNAFSADFRRGVCDTLLDIASQCDGVRCDMAMLVMNHVFVNTWGDFVDEDIPETDFWLEIIPQVKNQCQDFIFIAEAYWGLEAALQEQGFDFTYDKTLYDRIGAGAVQDIHKHLLAGIDFQRRTVRFIENHDEPRAVTSLGIDKSMAAAVLVCTLPGAVLLHDGQFSGRTIKLPVQIKRQPYEPVVQKLHDFYPRLLAETRASIYQRGSWWLFTVEKAWEGNRTHESLLVHGWYDLDQREFRLIVVNLTNQWVQGVVNLKVWPGIGDENWYLYDVLQDTYYYRTGASMTGDGLFVELGPYRAQVFQFNCVEQEDPARQPSQTP